MALPSSVNSTEETTEAKGEPYVNEPGVVIPDEVPRTQGEDVSLKKLFDRVKKSPEVMGIVSTLVDDIIGYGIDVNFVGRPDTPGTRKVQEAKQFINSGFKQELEAVLLDMLVTGDGYLYKRQITEDDIKNYLEEYVDENYSFNKSESKSMAVNRTYNELMKQVDESLTTARALQMVPASTIEHDIDEHGNITNFEQEVEQRSTDIPPEKMIHIPFMRLDGKTYGFTPLRTIVSEMDILANIKDTHGVFFDNAAVPNKIWRLENAGPNDANYKLLKETIKRYRRLDDKHKDIVLTGDIEIEDLNTLDKEMEFKELAEYVTNVITMAWGVPPSRIGIDVSGGDNPSRTASLTNEGYFKRVSRFQDRVATVLNSQFFMPEFDVAIEFRNPDIRTEIKKADRDLRQTEVAKQRLSLGLWNADRAREYLNINNHERPDDVEDEEVIELARQSSSSQNNLLSNQDQEEDAVSEGNRSEKESAETE